MGLLVGTATCSRPVRGRLGQCQLNIHRFDRASWWAHSRRLLFIDHLGVGNLARRLLVFLPSREFVSLPAHCAAVPTALWWDGCTAPNRSQRRISQSSRTWPALYYGIQKHLAVERRVPSRPGHAGDWVSKLVCAAGRGYRSVAGVWSRP